MAASISLLLIKRISHLHINPKSHRLFQPFLTKSLSTSPQSNTESTHEPNHKPSSLSSRLSFVFDQIDAIEKRHSEKDETLERIRAWRQSKQTHQLKTPPSAPQQDPDLREVESVVSNDKLDSCVVLEPIQIDSGELSKEKGVIELVHPWPEWMELMERLVKQNYFDHRRERDDDDMVNSLGIDVSSVGLGEDENVGVALFQDFRAVQNACSNFGKDRFDILRSLSRNDIQILVGHGCPATDRKVVFSGKLLRKRVHLDEGDVCSSCSLRNSCEKAFLLTNKEDEARTIDLMRILFTYGFDPLNGTVANKSLLKKKSVKSVVRKLLHEIVKLSAVPIDPNLTPPVIKRAPPKVKQPPPTPKRRVGRDDVEMKKGDWLCPKCDFMNFAKNTICLQCDAKRPKRQLLPGEWECPECNFLNYRRNMACFHCDCKRPADAILENKPQETYRFTEAQTDRVVKRDDVSNAWNFDFDDDESDGAEVAAFEYADSSKKNENLLREGLRDPEEEFGNLPPGARESSEFGRSRRPGVGFDDFDDEDDIDSYEIDESKERDVPVEGARSSFASDEFSEDEKFPESKSGFNAHRGGSSNFHNSGKKHGNSKGGFSRDDELGFSSDDEVSANPRWKSSHVASTQRGPPSRKLTFGSDEEFGLDSDMEDDSPRSGLRRGQRNNGARGGFKGKRSSYSASESDDDMDDQEYRGSSFSGNRSRGSRGRMRGGGRGGFNDNFASDSYRGSNGSSANRSRGRGGRIGSRRSSFDSDDEDYRGSSSSASRSRGNREDSGGVGGRMGSRRGGFDDEFDRKSSRGRGSGSFRGSNRGGRGGGGGGNRHGHSDGKDTDVGDFRNSRRVIER
ncbi:hypothetical protein [Arabidopsis thaliana]|uniref:Zinc finger (Ran-binding) family protein n=1 Tax=Arabidopsis thaliana TaxID=3702 RepID=Q9C7M2_ARATH|nr:zinc finger (Ran-binding) family protein [Arabidopsis thaliana]AAG51125.1 hypothetical protein [Arabidopsis thaliana]AEE33177.1 zinc finger (Ran-binding) family protein [Arabidopsis thaliana]|eukprot:NP_564674.1 zinc finger (Ran-binding) family protein [Arabidopsis thaliana]